MFNGSKRPSEGRPPGGPPSGGRMDRDWTQGSIFTNLVSLSWPMAVTTGLMTLGPTIDTIWVGKLGATALAAVGISGVLVMLAQSLMMGLTNGMRALISRSIGAKDFATANLAAQQSVVIAALYGIVMAIVGIMYSEELVGLIKPNAEVTIIAAAYLRVQFVGAATMSFRMMMDAIMQASGDSINPMWISIVYRLVHIALCPFLIFGWWIFPEMGVVGAALTSVISQSLGVLLGLGVLVSERTRVHLSFKGFRFDFGVIWRIVRIGLPASVAGIQRNMSHFFLQRFMAPFGTVALAAHAVDQRIEMFLAMPIGAFGQGAGVLVGQNLGANQPDRAAKSAWLAVAVVEVFAIVAALAVFIWTEPIIRIFNSEPAMIKTATEFLHIALLGYVMMGPMMVLMNTLQGAGDTVPTMIISIVSTWVLTIPLAYLLPEYMGWGVISIRWVMAGSNIATGLANIIYFQTGKWKTRRV